LALLKSVTEKLEKAPDSLNIVDVLRSGDEAAFAVISLISFGYFMVSGDQAN
jgi:hypothetical protein